MKVRRTGSSIWRARRCAASWALPQVQNDGEPSDAGRVMHSFLERISHGMRDGMSLEMARRAAVLSAPPHARVALATMNVDRIDHLLGLTPELALAFNVRTGAARILGVSLERQYEISDDEFAMTIDLGGAAGDVGIVLDFKRGWSFRAHPRENDQMLSAALALSRALALTRVHSWIAVWRDEEVDPLVMTHEYDRADLDMYELEVEATWRLADEARAAIAAGEPVPHVVAGDWCQYCPSRVYCPAYTGLVRQVLDLDYYDDHLRIRPMTPAMAAEAYRRLKGAKALIAAIEGAVYAAAGAAPLPLGTDADGRHRWFGKQDAEGNERLDADVTYDILAQRYGVEAAADATKMTTSKGAVERIAKSFAPRGRKEKEFEAVLDAIRAAGGASRSESERTVEFTTASPDPTDDPQID